MSCVLKADRSAAIAVRVWSKDRSEDWVDHGAFSVGFIILYDVDEDMYFLLLRFTDADLILGLKVLFRALGILGNR